MTDQDIKPRFPIGRTWDLVVLNFIAVGATFWAAAAWAARLPARYPAHWNARGEVDRWAEAGSSEWYALPIVAAVLAVLMVSLARYMPRIPLSLWNVPRKEAFLRLPPDRQGPIVTYTMRFILWLSVLDTALLLTIQWLVYVSAKRGALTGVYIGLSVVGLVYVGYMVWAISALSRKIRAATASPTGTSDP